MDKNKHTQSYNTSIYSKPATDFALSPSVAEERYKQWKSTDPYPQIEAALLNSADILAYIKATSLIYPFDPTKLQGASYDVTIEGDVVFYDEGCDDPNKQRVINLKEDGDFFDLQPNSIAFVTLKPKFRIPYYLALRFNLKITHIYKGLLLGTGPLVDPGFVGNLSIPLHNLTNNTYRFFKGDDLITMEFTKMSSNQLWSPNMRIKEHNEEYIPNDIDGDRHVKDYLAKALKNDRLGWVISSIPAAIQQSKNEVKLVKEAAEKAATESKTIIDNMEKRASMQASISIIAVITAVITITGFSLNALNKANDRYDRLMERYSVMEEEYSKQIENLTTQIFTLEKELNSILGTDVIVDSLEKSEDVQ